MYSGCLGSSSHCFFFFQAEDGIRDGRVTGVQTCALPILALVVLLRLVDFLGPRLHPGEDALGGLAGGGVGEFQDLAGGLVVVGGNGVVERSEERRVGKECRSRWSPQYERKKLWRRRGVVV